MKEITLILHSSEDMKKMTHANLLSIVTKNNDKFDAWLEEALKYIASKEK